MTNRLAIFIDGGYLDKVLIHELGSASLDYGKFPNLIARNISKNIEIFRVYYYHCLPYLGSEPTPEDQERYDKMKSFFDRLNRLPRYEIRTGKLVFDGTDETTGKPKFHQKQVDIKLGVDFINLSSKGNIQTAAIIAGDSDFIPAVQCAKNDGVSIWLFHGSRVANELWESSDERVKLTQEFIKPIIKKTK